MKKVALLAIVLFTIGLGFLKAQTNKGKVFLGVSSTLGLASSDLMDLGYESIQYRSDAFRFEESDPDKVTHISFLPKIGYFVADNLVAGIDLNLAFSTNKDGGEDIKCSQTFFSIGPFMRYYIPTSNVRPFFELNGAYGKINAEYDYGDNSDWKDEVERSNVMSIGGGIGLAAPLGKRVMFDILAGYNSLTVKEDNIDNDETIIGKLGLKLGFTILLGAN